jgi:hypothetical protein
MLNFQLEVKFIDFVIRGPWCSGLAGGCDYPLDARGSTRKSIELS